VPGSPKITASSFPALQRSRVERAVVGRRRVRGDEQRAPVDPLDLDHADSAGVTNGLVRGCVLSLLIDRAVQARKGWASASTVSMSAGFAKTLSGVGGLPLRTFRRAAWRPIEGSRSLVGSA
jgi:hypothetical protein